MPVWQPDDWDQPITRSSEPHPRRPWPWVLLAAAVAAITFGWWWSNSRGPARIEIPDAPVSALTNATFTPEPPDVLLSPETRLIRLPPIQGNGAIWGATGRDSGGHIWMGVSIRGTALDSARVFEYDPAADHAIDRGDVLTALANAGKLRGREVQPKIHSEIVQPADGNLYFMSMDETADEGGPRQPVWGSHLWRLSGSARTWEHLLSLPDGMIALTSIGDLLYSLGFPDHRLVQYNCGTGQMNAITVGSVGGHISRNLFSDVHGHVYVPRIKSGADGGINCALVEFDTALREVIAHPLPKYLNNDPANNHGIVGFQHLPDRSIAFVTHLGRLCRIVPDKYGPSTLIDLGWIHPKGESYSPSLFAYSGTGALVSIGRLTRTAESKFEWLCHDLRIKLSFQLRLPLPDADGNPLANVLLYGSETRDSVGNLYLGGSRSTERGSQPLLLQVKPTQELIKN